MTEVRAVRAAEAPAGEAADDRLESGAADDGTADPRGDEAIVGLGPASGRAPVRRGGSTRPTGADRRA